MSRAAPDPRESARALEALALLAVAAGVRRLAPARAWHPVLGEPVSVDPSVVQAGAARGAEAEVATAVARATRRLPWQATCLDQALAAQVMLRRRGRPGLAVIGLRPGSTGAGSRWPAHAWLVGGTGVITGAGAGAGYSPVSGFRPRAGRGTG